jgi:hypothetical protein
MKIINIIALSGLLTIVSAQMINQSENIIKDSKTNFIWQDSKIVKTEKRNFADAKNYCSNLEIDDIKGWSLPGFGELFSLVDTKVYNPTLSKNFKNFASDNYWSAKTFGHATSGEAFVINFKSGAFNRELMKDKFYVRCYKKLSRK